MIEAVNSVLQTAPFVRASSEQISSVDSFAANPDRVQKVPQAPFVSPYISVDVNFDKAVLQLRNGETGDVEDQFPSNAALEAQARQAAARAPQQSQQQQQVELAPERPAEAPQQSQRQSVDPAPQQRQQAAPAAPAPQQQTPAPESAGSRVSITVQQQAAFQAAAQSGNSNAGNITLLA